MFPRVLKERTKVTCPICFEALSDYPDQVGALTFQSKRVEAALHLGVM